MKCDCCGTTNDIAGVACSALGPISLCYCRACASSGAEPKGMIEGLIEELGFDQIRPELVKSITYFEDGEYRSMESLKPLPRGA